ncbi:TPA: hypothetical protein KEV35_004613 [Escherichia coli]|nr:hypothetical protein [Escherichia coli]
MNSIYKLIMLFLAIAVLPVTAFSKSPAEFNASANVNYSYDLSSSPGDVYLWKKKYVSGPMPNGQSAVTDFYISCLSDTNPENGACPVYPSWGVPRSNVYLSFTEKRSGLKHVIEIRGNVTSWCSYKYKFASANFGQGCQIDGITYNVYMAEDALKSFPAGGIWTAHLKMRVGQWHGGTGSSGGWPGFLDAYWTANITLHITDKNNIRIWLPQFHGSTANVVMPVMPAYWALNKPGLVSAEKVVETCLYDGYNSNSQRFEVTLNSNYTDSTTQDFLLQNTSEPTSKPLHYQVIASPPGQSGAMQRLNPGVTQTYTGINSTGIRQVMMPGLLAPVACVPWPIRIKLLPFDLSRQAAGHYTGTLSVTFTPSLD